MPKFYLYVQQDGEGCDYTIGCGAKLKVLSSTTLAEAEIEVEKWLDEHENSKCEISRAIIIDSTYMVEVDTKELRTIRKEIKKTKAAQAKQEADRLQYEKLKAQFEPKP